MDAESLPSEALPLLAQLYRERRSGLLSLGPDDAPLHVLLREGQVAGLGPLPAPLAASPRPMAGPDESARLRLERVLVEIGIRAQPKPEPVAPAAPARGLRERLVESLADLATTATFAEGAEPPPDLAETAGATEPLILEAVRAMHDAGAVRAALGDLEQRLVATAALAEERTLTLTEGYLLSRIDGTSTAREVLQLVPLDPDETERTLLGLLLTGRVEYRPAATSRGRPQAVAPPAAPGEAPPPAEAAAEADAAETAAAFPLASLIEDAGPEEPPAPSEDSLDPETRARRKEIRDVFDSLPSKNHFQVLGVEPGCSDGDVKRAYATLVKRFHPDAQRHPQLEDMHDYLEAIFIRVGEAWEVLGDARSRAQYEARFGVVRRPREAPPAAPEKLPPAGAPAPTAPATPPAAPSATEYVPAEEVLFKARLLISQQQYWDAIQVLESAVPQMEPRRNQHKGRILLARAYAKNPNWVRRAEENLHEVVREDPNNVEAHYELGRLYKQVGHSARAQAMFRRVVELRPEHREAAAELAPGDGPAPGGGLLKRIFRRGKAS